MHPKDLSIADFTYGLPEERIAKYPLPERDASRLLVWKEAGISEDHFRNIAGYIPQGSLMIYNQTRVVNARLFFHKPTGGKIEIFCLEPDARYKDITSAMQQKREVYWHCLVGGAARWKEKQVLRLITDEGLHIFAECVERGASGFQIRLFWDSDDSFADVLTAAGQIPLPPYLNRETEEKDKETYQTLFAKDEGSVAAPTAALHFTPNILSALNEKQVDLLPVTLHVGAGTFKPVKSDTMAMHDMHAEWIEVSVGLIQRVISFLKEKSAPLIAIGTTSCRTLESLYWLGVRLLRGEDTEKNGITVGQWYPYDSDAETPAMEALEAIIDYLHQKGSDKLVTRTQIIIAPGYRFRIINGLVTNFHQPKSTLLLLVAAVAGSDWCEIYEYALSHDFRFLSYGDGCLLWIK